MNLGGQSGPVESKSRWPRGQIRWPRANGPVLTTPLHGSKILPQKLLFLQKYGAHLPELLAWHMRCNVLETTLYLEGRVLGLIPTWCGTYTKALFSPNFIDHYDTICSVACAYAVNSVIWWRVLCSSVCDYIQLPFYHLLQLFPIFLIVFFSSSYLPFSLNSAIHKAPGLMVSRLCLVLFHHSIIPLKNVPLGVNGSHWQEQPPKVVLYGGRQSSSFVISTVIFLPSLLFLFVTEIKCIYLAFFHSCLQVVEESRNWLWLINVNDFPTLILPFISCWFQTCTTFPWLEVQITKQRLATMSVSLCTQARLHNLTIQVPNMRVWFPDLLYMLLSLLYTVIQSMGWQLLHRALLHSIWITQPSCWKSKLEVTRQATLFLMPSSHKSFFSMCFIFF